MGRAVTNRKDERAARLKAALRENLRRRKVQGRGRAEEQAPGADASSETSREKGTAEGGPDSDKSGL